MSATDAVLAGRRAREAIMLDRCIITAPGVGPDVFNETTGQYEPPPRRTVYSGKCRVQVKADINSNVVVAVSSEREQIYQTSQFEIPIVGSELVRTNHLAVITYAALDVSLLGREFQLQGDYQKSQSTCRRFRVKRNVG